MVIKIIPFQFLNLKIIVEKLKYSEMIVKKMLKYIHLYFSLSFFNLVTY